MKIQVCQNLTKFLVRKKSDIFKSKLWGGERTFEYSRNSNKYLIEISDGTIVEIIDFFVGSVVIN